MAYYGVKIAVEDFDPIRKSLEKIGAKFVNSQNELDTYFQGAKLFNDSMFYLKVRDYKHNKGRQHNVHNQLTGESIGYDSNLPENIKNGSEIILYSTTSVGGVDHTEVAVTPAISHQRSNYLKGQLIRNYYTEISITKDREIWYKDDFRIHLDDVKGLGMHVELELKNDKYNPRTAISHIDSIIEALGLDKSNILPNGSNYAEMLRKKLIHQKNYLNEGLLSLLPTDLQMKVDERPRISFKKGDQIIDRNKPNDSGGLYVIDSGNLNIVYGGALKNIRGSGEVIGELSFWNKKRTADVFAASDTSLIDIDPKTAIELLNHPKVMQSVVIKYSEAMQWK